jgi:small-conductance mechanosensitive channel
LELHFPQRPVELFFEEFGSSSINFVIRFWTKSDQKVFLTARSAAIKVIKKTFNQHGILPGLKTTPNPSGIMTKSHLQTYADFLA